MRVGQIYRPGIFSAGAELVFSMASIHHLNPNADVARRNLALQININAASALQNLLRTNLGPRGTLKMLVSGSGDLRLTKDGKVLLHEMNFTNPTAALIARAATAQDDVAGDGTTSNVILIGELLRQAERYIAEGLHPRIVSEAFNLARDTSLAFLDAYCAASSVAIDRETLLSVARTSLRTKLQTAIADNIAPAIVDAVLLVRGTDSGPVDLHMVEIMKMQQQSALDTRFVRGLVLDHGGRRPDMPRRLERAHVLILNVSLEYERTEVNAGFFYSTAEQRDRLVASERAHTDARVRKIIALKDDACEKSPGTGFLVVNQKGIDPLSLDMLAKAGILALRRAKRRNMERLQLACGGKIQNSVDDLDLSALGYAGTVWQEAVGDDKWTFIEDTREPRSATILLKGPNAHTLTQQADALRDGLRSVKNAIEDNGRLVPGAGAFQIALHNYIHAQLALPVNEGVFAGLNGRVRLGIRAFADAQLVIPKALAQNAGLDPQDAILTLQERILQSPSSVVGLCLATGGAIDPRAEGIWDNYRVVRHLLSGCTLIASNLLLVDEIMRAGRSSLKSNA